MESEFIATALSWLGTGGLASLITKLVIDHRAGRVQRDHDNQDAIENRIDKYWESLSDRVSKLQESLDECHRNHDTTTRELLDFRENNVKYREEIIEMKLQYEKRINDLTDKIVEFARNVPKRETDHYTLGTDNEYSGGEHE